MPNPGEGIREYERVLNRTVLGLDGLLWMGMIV